MQHFEHTPQPVEQSSAEEERFLLLENDANVVQVTLMERWANKMGLEESDAASDWIDRFAVKYRAYAEKNPGQEINVNSEKELERLQAELQVQQEETRH